MAASLKQSCGLASRSTAPSLIYYPKLLERMVKNKMLRCKEANTLLLSLTLLWDSGTVVFGTHEGQTRLVKLKVVPEGDAARSVQPTGVASEVPGHCWPCILRVELSPATPPTLTSSMCVLQMEALKAPAGKPALGCFPTDAKTQK